MSALTRPTRAATLGAESPAPRLDAQRLEALFDELFPICRSITGPGLRKSLEILRRYVPLELVRVPSGTPVFDWTVPDEWRIRAARLIGPDQKVVADFDESNLHVVSYSAPVDVELSLDELQAHLHSLPDLPDAIPYVTSYYQRKWGFCIPHRVRASLSPGTYRAVIDAEFVPAERGGGLDYGHCLLPGESRREILLTSYLCHPSLANNELSGPLVLAGLYERLCAWERRRYSYRFVVNPETIGCLCYLRDRGAELAAHVEAGLVLTCLGGPESSLSYKESRRGDSLFDRLVLTLALEEGAPFQIRPFTPTSGSDERQYCSPGFDLPVGQLARTVYNAYPGYHNSLDTKEFLDIEQIGRSIDRIEALLAAAEIAGRFRNLAPYGEPQLGRRGLYPNTNAEPTRKDSSDALKDGRRFLDRILYVLSYSDGQNDMMEIARRAGCSLLELEPAIARLEEAGLLALEEEPLR